jgi:hypothetical protein
VLRFYRVADVVRRRVQRLLFRGRIFAFLCEVGERNRRQKKRDGVAEGRAVMDNFIAFAEVVAAIIAAMGLAMWLEWATLNGLMHLMPGRHHNAPQATSKSGESDMQNPATRKAGPRNFPALTLFPH